MRGNGLSAEDVLYGDLQRGSAGSREWRTATVRMDSRNLSIDEGWVMEEWVGTAGWMARASFKEIPEEWLWGSRDPTFPLAHPDQDSLDIIQAFGKGEDGIIQGSIGCELERVLPGELDRDSSDVILRSCSDSESSATWMTGAASLLAVEHLTHGDGEWRYSPRIAELIYLDGAQILGCAWTGPEALLHG